jgi:hypothetical protein
MAETEDLLGKADALMARHRSTQTPAEPDAEIPVLHEVVDLGSLGDGPPLPTGCDGTAPVDEEEVLALAASLRTSLLSALQPEIDSLIEQRLKQAMAPRVDRLFGDLRDDLQLIARKILSDAVNSAVAKELERLKFDGKP